MATAKQRMLAGQNRRPDDRESQANHAATLASLGRCNAPHNLTAEARHAHVGAGVFLIFNVAILDVVVLGDRAQRGPAVQIHAPDHPRDAAARHRRLEFSRPIRIGADAWIGGGATVRGNPVRPRGG